MHAVLPPDTLPVLRDEASHRCVRQRCFHRLVAGSLAHSLRLCFNVAGGKCKTCGELFSELRRQRHSSEQQHEEEGDDQGEEGAGGGR